jgi:hypothetical protein
MIRNVPSETAAATPPPQRRRGPRFDSQIYALGQDVEVCFEESHCDEFFSQRRVE